MRALATQEQLVEDVGVVEAGGTPAPRGFRCTCSVGARRFAARRGSLLLGVLIVVMIASMVGLSMMSVTSIHRGEARGTMRRAQSRALAWSGVLAVVSQMESQRDEVLAGKEPELKRAWALGDGGVVRLAHPTGSSAIVVSESGKLDVNRATPEMLGKFESLPTGVAARIVQARGERFFESSEELARVAGLTAGVLYGQAAPPASESPEASTPGEGKSRSGMLSMMTVFSTDGLFRAGADGPDHRLRCGEAWSGDDRGRAGSLLGEELATALEGAIKSGKGFKDTAQIVQALRRLKVDPKQWDKVLDALTPEAGEVAVGKVDVNRASAEVLAAIPGIDREHAASMVSTRETLAPALRTSIAWPMTQGVLNEDAFELASNWITARSTMWRVRVEAGFRRGEGERDAVELEDAEIGDRSALEAVIDITDERVRVAYLRDVTYLETEMALEESGRAANEGTATETPNARPSPATPEPPKPPRPVPSVSGRLSMDRLDITRPPASSREPLASEGGPPKSEGSAAKAGRIGRWTRGLGTAGSKETR